MADLIMPEDYEGLQPFGISEVAETYPNSGQINAFQVSVSINGLSDLSGVLLHSDLYHQVQAGNCATAKFAPFSHAVQLIPKPATILAWVLFGLPGVSALWYCCLQGRQA